jgi:hypothetical protein
MIDIFEQAEIDARAAADEYDRRNTPERQAAHRAKMDAERAYHIAMGWYDEDGNPGPNAAPDDDEEDED